MAAPLAGLILSACAQEKPAPPAAPRTEPARQAFEQFMKLESRGDPALVDLYSDKAKILNSVRYKDGMTRVWSAPTAKYKEKRKADLAAAGEKGGRNSYTNVEYAVEAKGVRVKAIRCSDAGKATNTVFFLLGPDESGQWLILEERTLTQAAGSHGVPLPQPPGREGK